MKKTIISVGFILMTGNVIFAQAGQLKIAYINSAALLSGMPEKVKADSGIAKYQRSFQAQLEIMGKEYQTKGQDYQANEKKMTDAMKEVKMKEIQDLGSRIESIQQSAQEKVQQRRAEVYQPIIERADKALKEVAKEKDYDFIFDQASGGAMVFGKEQYDVTPLVRAKLGIK